MHPSDECRWQIFLKNIKLFSWQIILYDRYSFIFISQEMGEYILSNNLFEEKWKGQKKMTLV